MQPSWTEIIASLSAAIIAIFLACYPIIAPRLPHNKNAAANNGQAALSKIATAVTQEMEMNKALTAEQKNQQAFKKISEYVGRHGIKNITDSMIYTDIDSAVLVIKYMQGKLGPDTLSGTRRASGGPPYGLNLPQKPPEEF